MSGRMIRKNTQNAFAQPLVSRSRNRSVRIWNSTTR
jgi:hypothetical protein